MMSNREAAWLGASLGRHLAIARENFETSGEAMVRDIVRDVRTMMRPGALSSFDAAYAATSEDDR